MSTSGYFFPIVGIIYLIFRVWLVEFKLIKELGEKTGHLSRTLSYFLGILMIVNFSNGPFLIIILVALPTMIAAFILFDIPFLISLIRKKNDANTAPTHSFWLIIERLTLHLPLIVAGFTLYFSNIRSRLSPPLSPIELIVGLVFAYASFFLLDPRWTHKGDYPEGMIILAGALLETVIFLVLYFIYIF